ncbi:MAG: hypothetical protein WAO02_10155 [Verrucomicrobiia bacterium]
MKVKVRGQETGAERIVEQMNENNQNGVKEVQEPRKPKVGQVYWVQCKNHRTKATMGMDGKWRGLYDLRELPEVISFLADHPTCIL